MGGVRIGIGEEAIGGPRPEAHGGAKMKPGKVGGVIGVGLEGYPLLYGMIDAKGYLDGCSMASGNQGGYRFKDYLEAVTFVGQPHGYGTDCDFPAEISASVPFPYNNTPLVSSRPAAIPLLFRRQKCSSVLILQHMPLLVFSAMLWNGAVGPALSLRPPQSARATTTNGNSTIHITP